MSLKKLLAVILISAIFLATVNNKAIAQEESNSVNIDIAENLNTSVTFKVNLKDTSNVKFLTGFQLSMPFKITTNTITAKFNNSNIPAAVSEVDDKHIIKIDTTNLNVDLSKDTILTLYFETTDIEHEKYGVNYLYVPEIQSNFNLEKLKYSVTFPEEFSSPSFISGENSSIEGTTLTTQTDKSLFVMWGNSVSLGMKINYSIKNSDQGRKTYLLNLPGSLNQSTSYSIFPAVDGGVYDELFNNFGVIQLDSGSDKDININAGITITSDGSNKTYSIPSYGWTFETESSFSQNLLKVVDKNEDSAKNIKAVNNYLVENLSPYSNEKLDIKSIKDVWSKLGGDSKLSSIEYCYLAISAAEYLGYKGNLVYGYMVLPDILLTESRSPHAWCEINDGIRTFFIDPFLEDVFNLSYDFKKPIDRVEFGRWYPGMEYNSVLGLISDDSDPINAEFSNSSDSAVISNKLEITLNPQSDAIYSGNYYSADLGIVNNSNYFLELNSLKISDINYINYLKTGSFFPALLPNKATLFSLNNLIETNILLTGSKDVKTALEVDEKNIDQSSLETTMSIFFQIDIINILKNIVLAVLFIVLIYFIYKFTLHKKVKKMLKVSEKSKGENG